MSATQKLTHEMTILGCLISYGAAAYSECVDAGLCDADFTIDRHKRLWALLSRHAEAGEPLDLVRTIEAIIEADEQEAFGGLAYVAALPDSVPLLQLLPSYLREVRHGSQRRGLLHLGWWLCEQAAGVDLSVDELVAGVHERADAAAMEASTGEASSIYDITLRVGDSLSSDTEVSPPMETGIEEVDSHFLGGLKRQQLWVLAARPGVGKTAVALNVALGLARARSGVLVASLEQPEDQIGLRLASIASGIELGRLSRKRLGLRDWGILRGGGEGGSKVCGELETLSSLPLWVDDKPAQSLGHLRSQINRTRRQAAEKGHSLRVVVVDYIQRMERPKGESRDDSVGLLARGLADLARSTDVCIIALSQLSRAIEKRSTPSPQLSDLRESGVIEEAADVVIGLRRPHAGDHDPLPDDELELYVLKNRHGAVGLIRLGWDGPCLRVVRGRPATSVGVEYS